MDTVLNILPTWASPEYFGGFIYQDGDGMYYFHKDKLSYAEGETFYDNRFGHLRLAQINPNKEVIAVYR